MDKDISITNAENGDVLHYNSPEARRLQKRAAGYPTVVAITEHHEVTDTIEDEIERASAFLAMGSSDGEVRSPYGLSNPSFNKPAYRYIRKTDHLPTEAPDVPFTDLVAKVKLFNPTGRGTWYLVSYNPEGEYAFGVADLGMGAEAGDIGIAELVEFRGKFGLPIERDIHYTPRTVAELLKEGE